MTRTATDPTLGAAGASSVLVDAEWLARHYRDPGVRVVEIDVSSAAYDQWHLEGAVLWNIYSDLKVPDYRSVEPSALQDLFARSGIQRESTVVFYGYAPAFGFWLMKFCGHSDVRILDCSRETWRAGGHPRSSVAVTPERADYEIASSDLSVRADQLEVRRAIGDPSVIFLDVRSTAEYMGERFWPSGGMEPGGRAGHIPSAVHVPLDGLYDEKGAFRSRTDLAGIFSSVDLGARSELITYCTIGGRAATAWFVLSHLLGRAGVRVYDGSWAEWGRTADVPVEGQ